MKFIFKRNVVEWYAVEAQTEDEAREIVYGYGAEVINQDEGDLIFIGEEK